MRETNSFNPYRRDGLYFLVCRPPSAEFSVTVSSDKQSILSSLTKYLPPGWVETEEYSNRNHKFTIRYSKQTKCYEMLSMTEETLCISESIDDIGYSFDRELRAYDLEDASSKDMLVVHAGVVGFHGYAILLPGRSFAGKTTLVKELLTNNKNVTYYSDEYALIDSTGLVHAYPRKLTVRLDTHRIQVTPEMLGVTVGTNPLCIGMIVHTYYEKGACLAFGKMTKGEAFLSLFDNTLSARSKPEFSLRVLSKALSLSICRLQGTRGEASEAASLILTELHNALDKQNKL